MLLYCSILSVHDKTMDRDSTESNEVCPELFVVVFGLSGRLKIYQHVIISVSAH